MVKGYLFSLMNHSYFSCHFLIYSSRIFIKICHNFWCNSRTPQCRQIYVVQSHHRERNAIVHDMPSYARPSLRIYGMDGKEIYAGGYRRFVPDSDDVFESDSRAVVLGNGRIRCNYFWWMANQELPHDGNRKIAAQIICRCFGGK